MKCDDLSRIIYMHSCSPQILLLIMIMWRVFPPSVQSKITPRLRQFHYVFVVVYSIKSQTQTGNSKPVTNDKIVNTYPVIERPAITIRNVLAFWRSFIIPVLGLGSLFTWELNVRQRKQARSWKWEECVALVTCWQRFQARFQNQKGCTWNEGALVKCRCDDHLSNGSTVFVFKIC